ncbi:preprotein translocase, YajC subunit [compost metagenome]|jgi:preprotein translocase subunit YajC|uniref:preprotein translocase subunit YajC n=1 Tax=Edaphocola TaxID=2601681 RepID=UPI000FBE46A5|nr:MULTISPECIES: preprotein translocase subunit YajC [Edaphocola]
MITNVLLQAQQPGGAFMPIFMIGMIVVMYFFMIRPQQKKAKEQKLFAEKLVAGEKVVMTSGIHGRIVRTNDDGTLTIEIDRNTNITVERQAVSMEMTNAYLKKTGADTTAKVVS